MSTFIDGPVRTFEAGENLEPNRRVKLVTGKVIYAGDGERGIGINLRRVLTGEQASIRLNNAQGTVRVELSAAASGMVSLYGDANGKYKPTVSGPVLGTTLESGSGTGSIVEMLPE